MSEIQRVQSEIEMSMSDDLLQKEDMLLKEFDRVLEQEEMLWYQKSRDKWVVHGERNTKFFHTSTIIRRRRNRIEMLKDNENRWVDEPKDLEALAINYFSRLYSLEDIDAVSGVLPTRGFMKLSAREYISLSKPFTEEEVISALRKMGGYKAPGPDGFQPIFYQRCWDEVGDSVLKFALDFFTTGSLPGGINDVCLVLIPKITNPERITQFRPISLCNVLFKIITKALVNRMKDIMPRLIGPAQTSFIPGRLSIDNIVIVQEAVHSMKRKKGKKGWMLLKLDLDKAYNRIRWDFLEDSLRAAGFPDVWITWILTCVTNPTMSLLWNGEKTTPFYPKRGLRQGDPLSPYLFVICLERLCHRIEEAVVEKRWKPIRLSRGGPPLSHVCFADDLILFAEASVAQIRVIRGVLENFCSTSGQKVSLEKSKIYFSENVSHNLCRRITEASGIKSTKDLGKYLGMPILQKRVNKETFADVLARVSSRLSGWKSCTLSLAGRITLTKAVLSSIPVHTMSSICLPVSTLSALDRLARDFVWGSSREIRKQHLVSWERICQPKRNGGLGIRKSREMNLALIGKLGWRILFDRSSLWATIVRRKYRVGDVETITWAQNRGGWSSTWRSICRGLREVIFRGQSWVLGNGNDVRFWMDRWMGAQSLSNMAVAALPPDHDHIKASDLWSDGLGWDMARIAPYVTDDCKLELLSRVLDLNSGIRDRFAWGETANGVYTVSSGYCFLTQSETQTQNMECFFKRIWRTRVPERIKTFLWLVGNQAIMTNEERNRRHLSDTALCQVCKRGDETIMHILRDCPAISGIWIRLIPADKRQAFFDQTVLEWLFNNLAFSNTEESVWAVTFAISVWWSWKWRCSNVFGGKNLWRDRIGFIRKQALEVMQAFAIEGTHQHASSRVELQVSWSRPAGNWFKLNTDGASKGNPGLASAGGVIRDSDGAWSYGFALNIGRCSAPLAELWGVYYGLAFAWDRKIGRLEIEIDSELVVSFLKMGIPDTHPLSFLVHLCYGYLSRDWRVRIKHVYREANRLADGLANYAFDLPLGLHSFDFIPECVVSLFQEDFEGLAFARKTRL